MVKSQESDISEERVRELEKCCQRLLKEYGIRFVGFIDKMGRLVAGGLKEGITPMLDSEESISHYLKKMLEFTMKKDYDDTLGTIEHIVTKRKNIQIITFPLNEDLVLITTELNVDANQVIKKTEEIFNR